MTTPMMKQYQQAKSACGDALLFFRMGDFYELFQDDARVAAKVLGLTLTSRDKSANAVPMAGFPHHQLDSYLAKLIGHGHRVAVCEQVEDPKTAKGLVKREITQVVTPGTIVDPGLLDPAQSNFLAAACPARMLDGKSDDEIGVAWAESSTGQFCMTRVPRAGLADLLQRLDATELLLPDGDATIDAESSQSAMITRRPDWAYRTAQAREQLERQFGVATLDGFGIESFGNAGLGAAGALLEYLRETQKSSLEHINHIRPFRQSDFVEIDAATWRSLEISQTIRGCVREGSLLGMIDQCQTSMGSRLLGEWFTMPLVDLKKISARHDAVAELATDAALREKIRTFLKGTFDLQRLLARVGNGRSSPRDLKCVAATLENIPSLRETIQNASASLLAQMNLDLDPCPDLCGELLRGLNDDAPAHTRDGNFVREGYDEALDAMRKLAAGGKQWIAEYQQSICESTGIPSLKVGYNRVFGYYLEVTHLHREKIPESFIRKQTLKNAERYITPELKEYEEKVLSADSQADDREMELFEQLRELAKSYLARLKSNATIIARLDVLSALAQLAVDQNYTRPSMVEDSTIQIIEGRHPVLDIAQPLGVFIPNDTRIDEESGFLHLITGPNMAGKSTYIRQVALLSLLAQIGSFVPAKSATLGVVDKIFARVGASDELSRGQSTFMVEMTETARILNTATSRSLVILDEIGRGTSTYDGVSLAWAIVEYLHEQIGCRTLFATHYHELTSLEQELHGVRNYNVAVREWEDKIVFLHKIVAGGADRSYGIHVARLAGVPRQVNERAGEILQRLETENSIEQNRDSLKSSRSGSGGMQMTLFEVGHPIVDEIEKLDVDGMSPMQALQRLHEWKQRTATPAR